MFNEQVQWHLPASDVSSSQEHGFGVARMSSSSIAPQARCQVDGCTADLSLEEKVYCLKKRICSYHMRAEGIMVPGDPTQFWRFCFQCGKLEPLSQFDGPKRSCRAMLQRRKLPPRRTQSWTAGHAPSSSQSTASISAPLMPPLQQPFPQQPFPQHQHVASQQLQQLYQQRQHQQMLLEVQRQQLLQEEQMLLQQQASAASAAATASAVSGGGQARSLEQRQQVLMQQLAQLQAEVTQFNGLQPGGVSQSSCTLTPALLAGLGGSASFAATPGFDGPSTASNNYSPAASLTTEGDGSAQAAQQGPVPGTCMFMPGVSTAMAATAAPGLFPEAMGMPGQQQQTQVQDAAPTAAAAAAALAGSCGWPYDGSAAATAAAASCAAPAAARRVKRHKSLSMLLARSNSPEYMQEDDLLADMDVCDELYPMAMPSNPYQSVEDALREELAAALADSADAAPAIASTAPGAQAVPMQQQQPCMWAPQAAQAPVAGGSSGVLRHVSAGMLGPVPAYSNGSISAGAHSNGFVHHAGFPAPPATPSSYSAGSMGQPMGRAQGGMQDGSSAELHKLQLMQLQQMLQTVQQSVQELTMQIQHGVPAAGAVGTVGSAVAPANGFCGLPTGHPSM